jgi:hypothetical protein
MVPACCRQSEHRRTGESNQKLRAGIQKKTLGSRASRPCSCVSASTVRACASAPQRPTTPSSWHMRGASSRLCTASCERCLASDCALLFRSCAVPASKHCAARWTWPAAQHTHQGAEHAAQRKDERRAAQLIRAPARRAARRSERRRGARAQLGVPSGCAACRSGRWRGAQRVVRPLVRAQCTVNVHDAACTCTPPVKRLLGRRNSRCSCSLPSAAQRVHDCCCSVTSTSTGGPSRAGTAARTEQQRRGRRRQRPRRLGRGSRERWPRGAVDHRPQRVGLPLAQAAVERGPRVLEHSLHLGDAARGCTDAVAGLLQTCTRSGLLGSSCEA